MLFYERIKKKDFRLVITEEMKEKTLNNEEFKEYLVE